MWPRTFCKVPYVTVFNRVNMKEIEKKTKVQEHLWWAFKSVVVHMMHYHPLSEEIDIFVALVCLYKRRQLKEDGSELECCAQFDFACLRDVKKTNLHFSIFLKLYDFFFSLHLYHHFQQHRIHRVDLMMYFNRTNWCHKTHVLSCTMKGTFVVRTDGIFYGCARKKNRFLTYIR